jgi:hypothetical protein
MQYISTLYYLIKKNWLNNVLKGGKAIPVTGREGP